MPVELRDLPDTEGCADEARLDPREGRGTARGFLFGGLLLLLMAASATVFALLDTFAFGVLRLPERGAALSLISVFGILPAIGIGGMPWTLLALNEGNFILAIATVVGGFLLNFTLFGAIIGLHDPYESMRALLLPWWWPKNKR